MASQDTPGLDVSLLQPFHNTAGHAGILSDQDGEIIVKPCTSAEIDFYQSTAIHHPDFAEVVPTFLGTLALGDHTASVLANNSASEQSNTTAPVTGVAPKRIKSEVAIVLENLEHGFTQPNVIDIKLGSRLYAPGTATEKAARLDKVASETTSGSLNFRIAGMKVWNVERKSYDRYEKQYGRAFNKENVIDGFRTFFEGLFNTTLRHESSLQILTAIKAEIEHIETLLRGKESRFYSSSILVIYEGDPQALASVIDTQLNASHIRTDEEEQDQDDSEEDEAEPRMFVVKAIDFAHSTWCPGQGSDANAIIGLQNVRAVLERLLENSEESSKIDK